MENPTTASRKRTAAIIGVALITFGLAGLVVAGPFDMWPRDSVLLPFVESGDSGDTHMYAPVRINDDGRPASGAFTFVYRGQEYRTDSQQVDTLRVSTPSGERHASLVAGNTVELDGKTWTINRVEPWQGLLRNQSGGPMAHLAVRQGDQAWAGGILLGAEEWQFEEDTFALRFTWHESEAEAKQEANRPRPGMDEARWGVADGRSTTWFNTFQRGMGAKLRDGSTVVLSRVVDTGSPQPRLEFIRQTSDGRERIEVEPNTFAGPLQFEHPGAAPCVVRVAGYAPGRAYISAYERGHDALTAASVGVGDRVEVGDSAIRLVDTLPSASPVPAQRSPLLVATLTAEDEQLRVRQGEATRVGNARVQLVRNPDSRAMTYRLRYVDATGEAREVRLGPGDSFAFTAAGDRYTLHARGVYVGQGIEVQHHRVGAAVLWWTSAAMTALGLVLFIVARRL